MQVPVLVRAHLVDGVPVQEQTFTQIVSAHGGLLQASFRMAPGQKIRLINPRSRKEASCHVVSIGRASNNYFPTAFEFDDPNQGFGGSIFHQPIGVLRRKSLMKIDKYSHADVKTICALG